MLKYLHTSHFLTTFYIDDRLTIVLVTDVPMFAPIIMGIALLSLMRSPAVIVIMIDVLVEEDCTRTVTRMPVTSPAKGLSKSFVSRKARPLVLPPRMRNEFAMRLKDTMKR